MIEAAILLAAVGAADLVRALVARRVPSIVLGALVGTAVAVLGAVLAGAATWAAVVVVVLLALWLWAMTPEPGDEPERIWPALVVLVAAAIAAAGLPPTGAPHPAITAWYATTAPGEAGIAWTTALVTLGVVLFLLRSTNLLVRAAINSRAAARASSAAEVAGRPSLPSGAEGWRVRIGRRPVADVERVAASGRGAPQLVGGRVIGPIERLLLIGLGLAGEPPSSQHSWRPRGSCASPRSRQIAAPAPTPRPSSWAASRAGRSPPEGRCSSGERSDDPPGRRLTE
ncbi:hypothetical protein [Homoserinibacter gongjuensis]|uniref:Uncharacterized protein n=1 Tax=Homoserinibacter gongjuensis TaxID=1162968 RepID=A0ABQ6K266_9MICO|nr:hypothetical protein [Homoserinibacter gongjuensis]GMA92856.1 hypothetical protein GCM10025869_33850 [Homoserinibacter gongjuensis]